MIKSYLLFVVVFTQICFAQTTYNYSETTIDQILKNNPKDTTNLIQLGNYYHNKVMQTKDEKYIDLSEECFNKVLSFDSNNCIAKMWLGSLTTMKGKYAWLPWKKISHVEDGLLLMDEAVQHKPCNITARLIRANNNLQLPDFFNRQDTVLSDYKYVINQLTINNELQKQYSLPPIYLSLASLYLKKENVAESIKLWEIISKDFPESDEASEAKVNLNKYR